MSIAMPECTWVSRGGREIFRIKSYEKSYRSVRFGQRPPARCKTSLRVESFLPESTNYTPLRVKALGRVVASELSRKVAHAACLTRALRRSSVRQKGGDCNLSRCRLAVY